MTTVTRTLIKTVCALGLMALPAAAAAQGAMPMADTARSPWYVSSFIGATGGSDATATGTTVGVAGGWRGPGRLGFEAEVAATPFFFEQTGFLITRSVKTVSGNVLFSMPMKDSRLQPYATAGIGAVTSKLSEPGGLAVVDSTQAAVNFGAGVMASWNAHVGVRGDFRYSRNIGSKDDDSNLFGLEVSKLGFWRLAGGLVVGF